jgi:hypothetical protein
MGIPQAAIETPPLVAIGISPSVRTARPSMRSLRRSGRGFTSTRLAHVAGGHTGPELWAQWDFGAAGLAGETARGRVADTVRNESRARARRGATTVEPHSMASVYAIVTIDGWPPIRAVARTGANGRERRDRCGRNSAASRLLSFAAARRQSDHVAPSGSRPLLVRSGHVRSCKPGAQAAETGQIQPRDRVSRCSVVLPL